MWSFKSRQFKNLNIMNIFREIKICDMLRFQYFKTLYNKFFRYYRLLHITLGNWYRNNASYLPWPNLFQAFNEANKWQWCYNGVCQCIFPEAGKQCTRIFTALNLSRGSTSLHCISSSHRYFYRQTRLYSFFFKTAPSPKQARTKFINFCPITNMQVKKL